MLIKLCFLPGLVLTVDGVMYGHLFVSAPCIRWKFCFSQPPYNYSAFLTDIMGRSIVADMSCQCRCSRSYNSDMEWSIVYFQLNTQFAISARDFVFLKDETDICHMSSNQVYLFLNLGSN